MTRFLLVLITFFTLSGCEFYRDADPVDIARARYVSPDAPFVALISMVDTSDGRAAHSALLINGSQQVLFDPAGTFQHPDLPRSGDIHYGMTPRFLDYYERYHARFSHFVQTQKVPVSADVAEAVLRRAIAHGRTPKMFCATSVVTAFEGIAPFQNVGSSLFPENLRRDFANIPGVQDSYVREYDNGKNKVWEKTEAPTS